MNLNIFSELRKPGLVPGESLSLSTKFDSVLEKNQTYIMSNRMRSLHMHSEFVVQKFRDSLQRHPQDSQKQKLKVYTDADKHSHTATMIDLHIKLPGKSHRYLLEVKTDSSAETCVLALRA